MESKNFEFHAFSPSGSVLGELDSCVYAEFAKGFSKKSKNKKFAKKRKHNWNVWKFQKVQIPEIRVSLTNLSVVFLLLSIVVRNSFKMYSGFTDFPSNSPLWPQNVQSASVSLGTRGLSSKVQSQINNFSIERLEAWKSKSDSKTVESVSAPNFLGDLAKTESESQSRLLVGVGGSVAGQDKIVEKSPSADQIIRLKEILDEFAKLNLTATDPSNLKDLFLQLKEKICVNLYEEIKPQCNNRGIFSLEFLNYREVTPLPHWSGVAGRNPETNQLVPVTKKLIAKWYEDVPEQGFAIQQMLDTVQKMTPLIEHNLVIKEQFLGEIQTELSQLSRILQQSHFFDQSQVCIAKTRHFAFKNPAFTLQVYSNHMPLGGLDVAASANLSEGSFSVGVGKGVFLPCRYGGLVFGADVGWATNCKPANQTFGKYGGFALKFFLGYGVKI